MRSFALKAASRVFSRLCISGVNHVKHYCEVVRWEHGMICMPIRHLCILSPLYSPMSGRGDDGVEVGMVEWVWGRWNGCGDIVIALDRALLSTTPSLCGSTTERILDDFFSSACSLLSFCAFPVSVIAVQCGPGKSRESDS